MMDNLKDRAKKLVEKLKKIKHIEIYIAIGLALVLATIYFTFISPNKRQEKETGSTQIDATAQTFSSSEEYTNYLENKLKNVITSVKGVGDAKVMVTLEKGFEYVFATEEEIKTSSNGTTITTVTVVMVDGQPVIKEEIFPVVEGIVVVADGAGDVGVRMNILSIIQTVIGVDNAKINIMEGAI